MRKIAFLVLCIALGLAAQAQADYIPEQLGRDAHHIIQSLGAFVGNERAESQEFDITYMPAGNAVEGNMIINTADYRLILKLDSRYETCYELQIDIRSQEFLDNFYRLFATYRTENMEGYRLMYFGNDRLHVTENPSRSTKYRSFTFTLE
jgi:hypothetical protein